MKATIKNAEIRGFEKKINKQGDPYLLVRLEDETGKAEELVDKNIEHENIYHRGLLADVTINIDKGKYMTIRIENVEPVEG